MVMLSTDLPARHPVRSWSAEEWTKPSHVTSAGQQTALRRRDGRDDASQPVKMCERCGDALGVTREHRA